MRKIAWLISVVCLMPCSIVMASSPNSDVPPIIVAGMDAYKSKGPDEAVKAWIKGSPIDGSKEAMSQANNLRQVQDFYGSFLSFDVVSTREISPSVHILYLVLNYEKGPLFAKYILYRSGTEWILTSFVFNTSETAILPYQSTK